MDITKRSLQPLSVLQYRPDMPWMNFLKLCRLASFGHGSPATTAVLDSLPPIAREDTLNSSQNCRTLASQTRHYPPLTGTPYHYGPLAPSEIRIVSLLPGSEGDDIHCKVEAVDFSHRYSDYTALSYSWGRSSTQKSFKIYINGREFVVLENLYNALMALRKPDDIHRLWIDKICINQNKNDEGYAEKKIQIPLMGRLYSQAQSVIIWLGAAGNDSDFVMQTMGTRDVDQIQTYRFFSAFTHFIQREWFSRTWVSSPNAQIENVSGLKRKYRLCKNTLLTKPIPRSFADLSTKCLGLTLQRLFCLRSRRSRRTTGLSKPTTVLLHLPQLQDREIRRHPTKLPWLPSSKSRNKWKYILNMAMQ